MNRRAFLAAFTGGAAAFALDPERALWVPGKRVISVPAAPNGAPLLLDDQLVMMSQLFWKELEDNLTFSREVLEAAIRPTMVRVPPRFRKRRWNHHVAVS